MRSIDRRGMIVIIVAILAVTAVPASVVSATDQLVVESQHSDFGTGDETSPSSLTNLTIEGTGDSATVVLSEAMSIFEGFEDGDITISDGNWSGWTGDTGALSAQQSTVLSGSWSGEIATSGGGYNTIFASRDSETTNNLQFVFRADVQNGETSDKFSFRPQNATGSAITEIRFREDGTLAYNSPGGGFTTFGSGWSTDTTYEIEFRPNYQDNTFSIVINGGQYSNAEFGPFDFVNDASGAQDMRFQWDLNDGTTSGNAYIDDVGEGQVKDSATYVSANHTVSNAAELAANLTLENATATIYAEEFDGSWTEINSASVSTTANHTLDISSATSDTIRTRIEFQNDDGDTIAELDDESILFANQHPQVDNASASPSGGETVSETPVQLSINVSDEDFDTTQDDNVTVEFRNNDTDEIIGTDTLASNGTATTEWDNVTGGQNEWYVVATDEYGGETTSDTFSFNAPAELEVYNEAEPTKLIEENASLRARFFINDEENVIEREITNGTVSLEGLPANQQIIVTVRDENENFTYRRIIIDSIIQTSEIYLLPSNEPSSSITFRLDDSTGRFPSEETQLYVERPITRNNTTEYRVIAGDVFGGSGEFPVDLITDERYRLRVVNPEGEERVLGSYTVAGDDIAVLPIGRVVLEGNQDLNGTVSASIKESDGDNYDHVAKVVYLDQEELTDSLTITILDENGTKIRPETTETGPFGRYIETYPLENYTEGDSYTVRVEVDRDGETFTIERSIGELPDITGGWEIDRRVLELIGYVALVSVMGLVVIVSPPLGAASGVITAFILTIIGVTPIPMVGIAVAGCISILFMAGGD